MPGELSDKTRKAHFSPCLGKEDGDTSVGDQETTCKGRAPITLRPSLPAQGMSCTGVGSEGRAVVQGGLQQCCAQVRAPGFRVYGHTRPSAGKDCLNHPQGSEGTDLPDGQ